jgi:hypothetical protein
MTRRTIRDSAMLPDELGQDSFLDTISNLVGVLIILVVVVGAHARHISQQSETGDERDRQVAIARDAVQKNRDNETGLRAQLASLQRQLVADDRLLEVKQLERQHLLTAVTHWEGELDRRQSALDQSRQAAIDKASRLEQMKQRLSEVTRHADALAGAEPAPQAIDHYPTPIAKTVFRDDVHFRLHYGRIVFVPLDELIQTMKKEWELKAEQLTRVSRVVESVGPLDGFRLQYELVARQATQQTPAGPVTGRAIEFDHFVVQPVGASDGESIEQALLPDSQFAQRIARLDPDKHTVSVWVYPESYQEFNQIKRWLYERGFQTASWPLPEGGKISGGPNGYRATAQ